jgi:hypothetical protein
METASVGGLLLNVVSIQSLTSGLSIGTSLKSAQKNFDPLRHVRARDCAICRRSRSNQDS